MRKTTLFAKYSNNCKIIQKNYDKNFNKQEYKRKDENVDNWCLYIRNCVIIVSDMLNMQSLQEETITRTWTFNAK